VSQRFYLSAILVIVLLIGFFGTVSPQKAAASSSQRVQDRRNARLKQHSSSSVSSSSVSQSALWEKVRLSKRRGGGGAPQYQAASSSSEVVYALPTITFDDITKNYGGANFTLTPVSNSDGTFSFISGTPSVATISGNTVTIVGAGITIITATQAASGNFLQKAVTATLTVNTIAPTIVPLLTLFKNSTDPPFALADPTSNSAGAFTFTSTNLSVATVVGRTVTIRGAGTTTIISTQAANGNYKSGSGSTTLIVTPGLGDS
jgi:hypothetical protein